MADDLARFNAAPEPEPTMSDSDRMRFFRALQQSFKGPVVADAANKANEELERYLRHCLTFVVEELGASSLPVGQQEVISEYLFRQLGDLSSAIDNLRRITADIQSTDIDGILARYEGRI